MNMIMIIYSVYNTSSGPLDGTSFGLPDGTPSGPPDSTPFGPPMQVEIIPS
jgi:hypothetical protein